MADTKGGGDEAEYEECGERDKTRGEGEKNSVIKANRGKNKRQREYVWKGPLGYFCCGEGVGSVHFVG